MKYIPSTLLTACIVILGANAFAQDAMKKSDPMMKKEPTMQECKDHMAMAKKDAKKDDATMKMDTMCGDMMKKDGAMMKGDSASAPMKK